MSTSLPPDHKTSPRIEVLDVLRGFSLLGIALLNAPGVLGVHLDAASSSLDFAVVRWSELLLQGHFFPIFSLLFGISVALLMTGARRRGLNATALILRRLGCLAVFGLLHHLLQPGEVLLPYAVFGLLLLPFERLPLPTVLGTSGLITVVALWTTPILLTPAMFLLGLALQRKEVFAGRPQVLRWLFPVLATLAVVLTTVQVSLPPAGLGWLTLGGLRPDVGTLVGLVGAAALTTGMWLLVVDRARLPVPFRGLALLGRMSLSNYILQTLVFFTLGLSGLRGGEYWLALPATLLAVAINVAFSAWWMGRFTRGPLEWLWRWGTTLRRPALRLR